MEDTFQQEVTRRIQVEIGNLIVQLTMKNVEIEQLKAHVALLQSNLDSVTAPRPDSGQPKVKENLNGNH